MTVHHSHMLYATIFLLYWVRIKYTRKFYLGGIKYTRKFYLGGIKYTRKFYLGGIKYTRKFYLGGIKYTRWDTIRPNKNSRHDIGSGVKVSIHTLYSILMMVHGSVVGVADESKTTPFSLI